MLHPRLLTLVARLGNPESRDSAARELASHVGAEALILFVPDTELSVLLPAPGFAQTLPRGTSWPDFLVRCDTSGQARGKLPLPVGGEIRDAVGHRAEDGAVLVLLGGAPDPNETGALCTLLPLLSAACRGEQAIVTASGHAASARQAAAQARALAGSLETARQELRKALRDLRASEGRKDEFLAMLAHELRNPLGTITNAVHVLQIRGGADPKVQRATEVIERQARNMRRLVEDLLDVSRISRGSVSLEKENLDLRSVVAAAVESCRPLADQRGHRLGLTLFDRPVPVHADAARLEQVVSNLVNNAAKYTEPGGHIDVSVKLDGARALVSVRDTGQGITPDLLPRIFDLFTQAERGRDRSQGGLGIGLTVVRNLVEMHGGSVEAASEGAGKGSTFTVVLPLLGGRERNTQV